MSTAATKLLDAAVAAIRHRGYSDTSVDDICRAAGVSKGAFFHHFRSKDELGAAAGRHFNAFAEGALFGAPFMALADPRERLLSYLRLRREIIQGSPGDFCCYLGTIVQEAHESRPELTAACGAEIFAHAERVEAMAEEAKARCAPDAEWSPKSLALFTQASLQGAFVLAKAGGGADVAIECIDHLIAYVERLLPVEVETRSAA
jgi:TetR/AcrR family transcriptional regulator, transcriptional repressor for nem operon